MMADTVGKLLDFIVQTDERTKNDLARLRNEKDTLEKRVAKLEQALANIVVAKHENKN